jgi:LuxR family transcriptional regulator, maltose regulon positive regulatory protein
MPEPDLLVTKFTIPPVRSVLLARSHLLEVLEQSRSVPLTLLSASAGFGKTTLLSVWAGQNTGQLAWLTLDDQDNDPTRFWTYVIAALRHSGTPLGEAAEVLLHAPQSSLLIGALTSLINELATLAQHTSLILDDYQVITEPAIHTSLQFVLDRLPPRLHLCLSSRSDPPLALARLRAKGQVVEIREPELRLSDEEAAGFLTQVMGLSLSAEEIARLETRTEGWIAGLQLAALALRRHTDASAFLQAFTGSHRLILDYVQEEILEPLPKDQHRFLLQVSVLERMNADVCQRLSGEPASQQMLESLERAHLFLVPLDEERRWYRLHPLFREVLLARLQAKEPEQVTHLHREAAAWYATYGWLHEAISHALEANDFASAADLVERWILPQHWRNEYHLLRRWAERLPEDVLHARPELSFAYATAVVLTSPRGPRTLQRVEAPLHQAEEGFRASGDQAGLGAALVARAVLTGQQGAFAQAFALARQALDVLPEDESQWRGHALCLVGMEAALAGELTRAQALLRQGLAHYERAETLPGTQFALTELGDVCLEQGELHLAARSFRQALASSEVHRELAHLQLTLQTGERETYYERMARYGMASLAYEWNDLDAAERELGEALLGPAEWRQVLTGGVLLQVRLLLARGAAEQAREVLADLAVQASQPEMLRELQMCQAYLALSVGDLVTAQRWAASVAPEPAPLALTRREEEALLLARVRLAEGQAEAALGVLARWQQEARTSERQRGALHLLVLEALAHQASGAVQQAKETLLQALTLARPEGYQRLFLDEGQPIASLLQTLLPDLRGEALAAYVRTLLRTSRSAQAKPEALPEGLASGLVAPLTPRERRVLQLLAEGASNQEIARQLVVSLATAKKHVASILSKLGAANRTQAIARARSLSLL